MNNDSQEKVAAADHPCCYADDGCRFSGNERCKPGEECRPSAAAVAPDAPQWDDDFFDRALQKADQYKKRGVGGQTVTWHDGADERLVMAARVLQAELTHPAAPSNVREQALEEALRMLHDETADYIRLNNLGDPWQNQSMRMARDALKSATPDAGKTTQHPSAERQRFDLEEDQDGEPG